MIGPSFSNTKLQIWELKFKFDLTKFFEIESATFLQNSLTPIQNNHRWQMRMANTFRRGSFCNRWDIGTS